MVYFAFRSYLLKAAIHWFSLDTLRLQKSELGPENGTTGLIGGGVALSW